MMGSAARFVKGKMGLEGPKPGEHKHRKSAQEQSGQTKTHIAMNLFLQIAMTIAFVFNVQHETFPKPLDVPDPPGLGEPGESTQRSPFPEGPPPSSRSIPREEQSALLQVPFSVSISR